MFPQCDSSSSEPTREFEGHLANNNTAADQPARLKPYVYLSPDVVTNLLYAVFVGLACISDFQQRRRQLYSQLPGHSTNLLPYSRYCPSQPEESGQIGKDRENRS